MRLFEVRDLHVSVGDKHILSGVDLRVRAGEVLAVMGPNGSGKSTLAHAVMGDPRYTVTRGDILLDGESILPLRVDERARRGMFLGFQYPLEVPGVSISSLLWAAISHRKDKPSAARFNEALKERMTALGMDASLARRSLNEGFSGGEKKRAEVVQMSMLEPEVILLDEPDSGLDVDAMRVVADAVNRYASSHADAGVVLITHYQRMLDLIVPDRVHVIMDGRIVRTGDRSLAKEIEARGYGPRPGMEVA